MAGEVFKDLYGIHTAYYLTINDLGKSKGEKLVTIIALMPSRRVSSAQRVWNIALEAAWGSEH